MPRINILDRQTAELIAAGEVIDRPSSVVKELVENAIDSGASAITVEIKSGGIRSIRVTDNGCGILREDIPKAFLRHATSKILTQEDLNQIGTLGFRGEALASICAVGRVELLTRSKEEPIGSRYQINGGEGGEIEEAGCPLGTTLIVRDLFYNVPARMKFLKKDSTEGNAVAALLDRLALSHPEVSFQFIREGQRRLYTPGDGKLLSAVFGVYGGDFGNSLIPVENAEKLGGLRVTGYITKPEGAKATRSMEHFFINHRYVKSGTMMAALEEAYKNSLMTGKFPGCVLNLELPLEMVDVNVHPTKLEVKLSDEKLVFTSIYNACKGALSALGTGTNARDTSRGYQRRVSYFELKNPPFSGEQQRMTAGEYRKAVSLDTDGKAASVQASQRSRPKNSGQLGNGTFTLRDDLSGQAYHRQSPPRIDPKPEGLTVSTASAAGSGRGPFSADKQLSGARPAPGSKPRTLEKPPVTSAGMIGKDPPSGRADKSLEGAVDTAAIASPAAPSPEPEHQTIPLTQDPPPPLRLIGEAFGTYILAESAGDLCLIDKHAAHERLLFEELKAEHQKGTIPRQLLLTSMRVSLSKDLYDALLQNPDPVSQAGFGVEDFGDGSVLVREVPAVLSIDQVEDAVLEMAETLKKSYARLDLDLYDQLFHSVACKAAVKGNRFSERAEQQELLDRLARHPNIRNCPHGRPVMIVMTRRELEKMFGRIV